MLCLVTKYKQYIFKILHTENKERNNKKVLNEIRSKKHEFNYFHIEINPTLNKLKK